MKSRSSSGGGGGSGSGSGSGSSSILAVCAFYYHTPGAHNRNANGNLATCILLFRKFMVSQRQAAKRHWRHLVT